MLALAVYARTLAPSVTLVDSGELIVAARNLGIGHPPGFPLYLMLAHLATYLPVGDVAWRVNLASAVFASLAAGLLTLAVFEADGTIAPVTARPAALPDRKRRRRSGPAAAEAKAAPVPEPSRSALDGPAIAVAAVVAGLLLAGSRTLWAYATVAEVYTLNTLLVVGIIVLMLGWRRASLAGAARADRRLLLAAVIFGVALGNHHATVGLTLPALAFLVWATAGSSFFRSRRLFTTSLVALAGVGLVYAYLPIAAAREPVLNWGDPRTLERIWWHVTGRQYWVYLGVSVDRIGREAAAFFRLLSREFGPPWLPAALALAILGFVTLARRDRTLTVFLGLVIAANVCYGLVYEIAEWDKDAYYLPVFLAVTLAAGVGAATLLRGAARRASARGMAAVGGLLLAAPALAFAGNFPWCDRSRDFIARDYADNILATVEPGGLLLTTDWQVSAPFLYLQEVEARRRDVAVVDVTLLLRSWYFPYLERRAPDLFGSNTETVRAYLEDLVRWEQDPPAYARDAALTARINTRFHAMLVGFVRTRAQSGHAYLTLDMLSSRDGLIRSLLPTYQLVPQGLVFELVGDRAFRDPAEPRLVTRGLADGTQRFEPDGVVQVKVLPVYLDMLVNRGVYLARHGDPARAARAAREALALNPTHRPAQDLLARVLGSGAAPRP